MKIINTQFTSIIQIITTEEKYYLNNGSSYKQEILGLGSDSKMYSWDYNTAQWVLVEKKA